MPVDQIMTLSCCEPQNFPQSDFWEFVASEVYGPERVFSPQQEMPHLSCANCASL